MATNNKRQITLEILGDAKSLTQSAQQAERELAKLEAIKLETKKLGVDFDASEVQEKLAKLDALKQAKLVLTADVEIDKAQRELDKFGTASSEAFKAKWQAAGDSLASVGQRMSIGISAPIVGAFGLATKAAAEYEDQLNVVTETFGPLAGQVKDFAEGATSAFGLSKREAIEVASSFGLVLDKTELSKKSVADYSTQLAGLAGDLSSFFGKTTQEASAAIRSGLVGESEPLRAFGVILSENAVKAKAYASGIAEAGSELTETQKIQARMALILEQTSKAQGDFNRTQDSAVNASKIAKKEFENAAVSLGQSLTPALAAGAKTVAGLAREFSELPKGVQQGIVVFGGLLAAMGPVLTVAGNAAKGIAGIKGAIDGLKDAEGNLTRVGKGVAALGVAGAVVGGFIALNSIMKEIENRKVEQKFNEIKDALAGINGGSVQKFTEDLGKMQEEVDRLANSKVGKILGEDIGKALKESDVGQELERITKAFGQLVDGGNIAGAERIIRQLGESGKVSSEFIATLQKKVDDYSAAQVQARKDTEASNKMLDAAATAAGGNVNALDALNKITGAATGSAKVFGQTMDDVAAANARAELETAKLVKSINDADEKVRDARQKQADAARESAERIADAERNVVEVKNDAAERYAEAVQRQKDTAAEGAERIADAERKVAEAAEKGAEAVAKAKADAAAAVAKANQDISDAEYNLQTVLAENADAVNKAQKNVADVTEASARKVAEADKDLADARTDSAARVREALDRQVEVEQRAADRIEQATQRVSDAHRDADRAVADVLLHQQEVAVETGQRIADAELRVAQAAEDGAERVKAAKESAAEAAENAAERIAATEKSSADQVKGADKNVAQARKDRDKAIKDGSRDVVKAEKDYAEAVAKSGANSQQAADAAERLTETRERVAERIADAEDRVTEAEERAAAAREKGEKDVAKAKADATKAAEENAKRIEKAEKDAADGVKKAEADLAKARADATKAQIDAATAVQKAQEKAALDIAAAEAGLESARKQNDADRIKAAADVAKAEEDGRKKVEDAEGRLKDTQVQAGKDRQQASDDLYRVIGENAQKEIKAQADVGKAYQEKAAAEVKGINDVKAAETNAAKDRESAVMNLQKVTEASEKANQKSSDETRKVVEANTEAIAKAVENVGEARKTAAETAKKAEDDLNGAIDDQKLKLLEAKTNVGLLKDAYVSNVDTMISKVRDLSREIGLIPPIPTGGQSGGGGGSGDFGGGQTVTTSGGNTIVTSQSGGQNAAPTGTYAIGPDGQQIKVDYVVGGAGAGASIQTGTAPDGVQGPSAFNGASAGITTSGPTSAIPVVAGTGPVQGPVAPTSGTVTIAGHVLPKGSQYGASGDVDQPGGEMGIILRAIRMTETGNTNVYNSLAKPWPGPASGVYQFIGSTWRSVRGAAGGSQYEHAVLAPIVVQHNAAINMANGILTRHNGFVDAVPGCWFHEGIYSTPSRWNTLVDSIVGGSGNPGMTMAGYIRKWLKNYRSLGGKRAVSPAARSLDSGGGAGVDLGAIPSGGIPTNAGSVPGAGAVVATTGAAGAASGGGGAVIGGVSPNIDTLSVSGPPGSDAATIPSTYIAPNGINASLMPAAAGGANQVVSPAAQASAEAEIARQRAAGAAIELRVVTRRREMVALEELAAAMRAEQLAAQQGITDSKELERLHADVVAAQAKAAAAEEAKIRADRAAGFETEKSTAGARSTGEGVEREIQRIRTESQEIAGQAIIGASDTAAHNTITASETAGHNIVDASAAAGQNIVGIMATTISAAAAAMGLSPVEQLIGATNVTPTAAAFASWTPGTRPAAQPGPTLTRAPQVTTTPGANTTVTGSVTDVTRTGITGTEADTVTVIERQPFIITLDGKVAADFLIEAVRQTARRNGDKTADGALRITRR